MRSLFRDASVGGWAIRVVLVSLVVATVLMAVGQTPRPAAAPLSNGLLANVYGNYQVRPDDGVVYVDWFVDLDNTGPSPFLDTDDPLNHPSEIQILVPNGFSDFRAYGPSGSLLNVTFDNIGYGTWANLPLGGPLAYGDIHSLSYSYTMSTSEEAGIIIRDGYVYFPADHGLWLPDEYGETVISFVVPWEHVDNVAITGADCDRFGNDFDVVFDCYGDEFGIFAEIEIVDPSSRIITTQTINIDGRPTELILRYLEGDDAWAENATAMAISGVPLIGEIMGIPYSGPDTIRISEKGGNELYGYAGLADCDASMCAVAVSPSADDQTLLHEFVHMWTEPFDNRWLAEGIAEYVSLKAAAELGVPGYEDFANPALAPDASAWTWGFYPEDMGDAPSFSLDPWGSFGEFAGDEFIDEVEAYYWSTRFFQELELVVGDEPFRAVNSNNIFTVSDRSIDSSAYIDLLEDVGDATADGLFSSFIFAEYDQQTLSDRRTARDRLAALESSAASDAPELNTRVFTSVQGDIAVWNFFRALESLDELEAGLASYLTIRTDLNDLRTRTEEAGLAYPIPFQDADSTWEFEAVEDSFGDANLALAAYLDAVDAEAASGSIFQRIGLLGKDTSADLQVAADHFAWARFDESIAHSRATQNLIERAHSDGVTYAIVVSIVVSAMVLFAAGVFVISRRMEPAPAGSSR
ncbi:MAG: hypothetical protein IH957_09550 [Chloroflexi bacterium]|nr:hypothetical protein [Chloroflexota bacterium]